MIWSICLVAMASMMLSACSVPVSPSPALLERLVRGETADGAWRILRDRGFAELDPATSDAAPGSHGRCFGKARPQPAARADQLLLDEIQVCFNDRDGHSIYTRGPGAERWVAYTPQSGE